MWIHLTQNDVVAISPYNIIKLRSSSLSLSPLKGSVIVAVNQEYIDKEQVIHLKAGDEVAIIPPISGG